MFKQVICRSCDGNGCVNCCRSGVVYKEIDDPTLALHDEIAELKRALEIANKSFREIDKRCSKDDSNPWIIASNSVEKLGSLGE
jgi:hypothetical protein